MDISDGNLEKIKSAVKMDPDIVTKLIKKDGEDGGDVTMLWQACSLGLLPVVEYLCDVKGVDVNFRNPKGSASCLYIAAQMGFKDCCDILIKKGANVNPAWDTDATPLFIATQRNHIEVVKLLIENGADVDAKNSEKSTPFVLACKMGLTECSQYLLSRGANAYENSTGMTPLQWAKKEKRKETFATLMETVFLRSFYVTTTFDCWRRRTAIQRKVKNLLGEAKGKPKDTNEPVKIKNGTVEGKPKDGEGPAPTEEGKVEGKPKDGEGPALTEEGIVEGKPKDGEGPAQTEKDGVQAADQSLSNDNYNPLINIINVVKVDSVEASSVATTDKLKSTQRPAISKFFDPPAQLLSRHGLGTFPKINVKFENENAENLNRKMLLIGDCLKTEELPEKRRTSLRKSLASPMHRKQSIFVGCLSDDTNITPVLKPFLRSSKFTGKTVFSEAFLESSMSSPQKHVAKEPPKNENPLCIPGKTNADYFREHGKGIIPQYKTQPSSQALMLFKSYPTKNHMLEQKRLENESRHCSPHRVVTIDTRTRTGKESPNKAYITSRESLLKSPLQSPCGARSAQGVTHSMHHLSGGPGIQSYPQYRSASEKDRAPANRFRDQDRSFEIIPSSGSRSNLSNNMSSKQMRHRSDDFGSFSQSPRANYWNTLASNSSVNERGKRSILDMAVIAGVTLSSLPNDGIVRHSNVENDMNSYPYKLSAGPLSPPGFPFYPSQSPISKQRY